jgi:hypothetical protein
MFETFDDLEIDAGDTTIFVRRAGSGPLLLLLHGFPETHLMWRDVAPLLARQFSVVCADLRGYGRSGCPPSDEDHGPYAKRAMARDMAVVMEQLGHTRFAVAGHDRLILWSESGPLGTWYSDAGGPLALWREWADDVRGRGVTAGHFFPEELPVETATELSTFFRD